MSWIPNPFELPPSEHLREDINLPEEPEAVGAEDTSTATDLNAAQQVPGLRARDEIRRGADPEQQTAPGEDGLASPEES